MNIIDRWPELAAYLTVSLLFYSWWWRSKIRNRLVNKMSEWIKRRGWFDG